MNDNNFNINSYDFLSFPHNPEDFYTLLYKIEKNSNYEIYKAINNETREIYAIKIIPFDDRISYPKLKQEAYLMKSLKNCENIVRYYGSFLSFKSKSIWLIYEYCPSGSLYDLLKQIERPLTEKEISIILHDILNALTFIHQLNIIHSNIKITNILINENAKAKLGNFSKAIQTLDDSLLLSSSERKCFKETDDPKYDNFLLGIVCVELYKGINDFDRSQFMELIKNNNNINALNTTIKKYFFEDKEQLCSNEFIDFIQKCLESNINKRSTALQLKNHPYIKNNTSNLENSEKKNFLDLIKNNIEKIEYFKKEKKNCNTFKSIKTNGINFSRLYSSVSINTKLTKKSNFNNNDKNVVNISNIINNNNEINISNNDKLAEFKFAQMGKNEEVEVEFDKYTNKDILVDNSNLDNTGFHYCTDDSMDKSLKQSAAFGMAANKSKKDSRTLVTQKKKPTLKGILKGEKKNSGIIKKKINFTIDNNDNNSKSESNNTLIKIGKCKKFLKVDSGETDYLKANWEHLSKYEGVIKSQASENNNNYNYDNHFLNFNIDDSFDLNNLSINNLSFNINNNSSISLNNSNNEEEGNNCNNEVNNNNNEVNKCNNEDNKCNNEENKCNNEDNNNKKNKTKKMVSFSDIKCTVIQLGTEIKKYKTDMKSNSVSFNSSKTSSIKEKNDFSLKNSLIKQSLNNETKKSLNKSQKLLISFKNNDVNDYSNGKKSLVKERRYRNDINSTTFTSINTPINKHKGFMEIIPEKYYSCKPFITSTKKYLLENESNNENNFDKKSKSKININQEKSEQKPYLYNYIKDISNKNNAIIRKSMTNIIKVGKLFKKNKKKIKKM